ncbi:MAG TPA: gluconate 2-dehydrogenase subunit 3 family protein [Bryobacteraceae bacterium]|nr:gluconate 2-dehydrogenase subunit 3 family protein [Bryobacteraceae bacterium]
MKPQFFNSEQNQILIAIGDRIVPGSAAAQCNRLIDLFMTLASEDHRQALLHALAEFDGKAKQQFQKPFHSLAPEQQDALLSAASTPHPSPSFAVVKEWMADSYWSSREGLRELGWDGRMAWESYPACEHSEAGR